MRSAESTLHEKVASYLKLRHPRAIFASDFAAGLKMPIWLAARQKRLKSGRAYPDLFVAEPRGDYHGLFIELKAVNIYLRSGALSSNKHLQEQAAILEQLNERGYKACFAVGFDEAKQIIDNYLLKGL